MQVFIPYPDFDASVACLDRARLGKQRVECQQILAALGSRRLYAQSSGAVGGGHLPKGWVNHPATVMWEGCDAALGVYMTMCVAEWRARGYVNNMVTPYNEQTFLLHRGWPDHDGVFPEDARDAVLPAWWGREDVHASHQSNLLRKAPEHYGQFGWTVGDDMEYIWPTRQESICG